LFTIKERHETIVTTFITYFHVQRFQQLASELGEGEEAATFLHHCETFLGDIPHLWGEL
jgi:hypothetical protein